MKFHVLTLFPEMIMQGLEPSIIGRAVEKGIISLEAVNIRDYTDDKHGKVDDYPYGGGAGMLMQAQPVYDAYRAVTRESCSEASKNRGGGKIGCIELCQSPTGANIDSVATGQNLTEANLNCIKSGVNQTKSCTRKVRTIYVTPQGTPFTQKIAKELAKEDELVFLCGHYEGIDERVLEEVVTDYISIGDYVLTGGELPAMVMIDAIARLIPGVLGNDTSAEEESFHNDLLEYPQYSRPEVWHEKKVPEVLLSGNHKNISAWRLEKSKERTALRRPDLYEKYQAKQRLIKQLSKDKRNNIHMIESLAAGRSEIIYAKGEDVLLYDRQRKVATMLATDEEAVQHLVKQMPQDVEELLVSQEVVKKGLEASGFQSICACEQFLYTQKVTLPVKHKDIRRLTPEHLEYICRHYIGEKATAGEQEYVCDRINAGAMYGAFVDEKLVGFIGVHGEGSSGMLYVEEAYRGRGIALSLEAYLVNRLLEKGRVPYGHVILGNEMSVKLQEKLGFYKASKTFWWMEKSSCK